MPDLRTPAVNRLQKEDNPIHDWYRFVLSFPPQLVRKYLQEFNAKDNTLVCDPFCGTGTTLVECVKQNIPSIGFEALPMPYFASKVKTNLDLDISKLSFLRDIIYDEAIKDLIAAGISDEPLFNLDTNYNDLLTLNKDSYSILIKNSISPLPLHKLLILKKQIDTYSSKDNRDFLYLALAYVSVANASNLRFGPEVGVGKIKQDSPVVSSWYDKVSKMIIDLESYKNKSNSFSSVYNYDSRSLSGAKHNIDIIITSPPYPNEKDYTRTTRLESAILGLIKDKKALRSIKQDLVRSNTRNVYKYDNDDDIINQFNRIIALSKEIEEKRIVLGKTSGFEKLYSRVTSLYFGGMYRHLKSLKEYLNNNAMLAYVVGDQASYFRIKIETSSLLADIAKYLDYKVVKIDLFRERYSTATKDYLREDVLILQNKN